MCKMNELRCQKRCLKSFWHSSWHKLDWALAFTELLYCDVLFWCTGREKQWVRRWLGGLQQSAFGFLSRRGCGTFGLCGYIQFNPFLASQSPLSLLLDISQQALNYDQRAPLLACQCFTVLLYAQIIEFQQSWHLNISGQTLALGVFDWIEKKPLNAAMCEVCSCEKGPLCIPKMTEMVI